MAFLELGDGEMRKLIIVVVISLLLPCLVYTTDVILEIKGGYFSPADKDFREIYGSGLIYGSELTIRIWENFELWIGVSHFRKDGELTFTQEETKINNIPFGSGIKYRFFTGDVSFYGGLGINYFHSKEINAIGDVTKNGLGYVAKIGSYVEITSGLLIDIYGEYSYCKIKPPDFGVNIGGFSAGIGLGYGF